MSDDLMGVIGQIDQIDIPVEFDKYQLVPAEQVVATDCSVQTAEDCCWCNHNFALLYGSCAIEKFIIEKFIKDFA